ncbi:MAG: hypothetical protein RLZZ15_985, partial [Verrucomicrobiota bacterium]
MDPVTTLPHKSWLERTLLGLAVGLVVLGTLGALGWWLGQPLLIQPFRETEPIKINAALAFLAIGLVLLAMENRAPRAAALALLPGLLGLLVLVEHVFSLNVRIDEILATDHLSAQPGRMSAMVAAALASASLLLAWRRTERGESWRLMIEPVAGSLIASAGLSTLLGYAARLGTVYRWGTTTPTAPVEAIGLMLLGLALLGLAFRDSAKSENGPPSWSPMPGLIFCFTLTVILWIGLGEREREFITNSTTSARDQLAGNIEAEVESQQLQFARAANRWSGFADDAEDIRRLDAATMMAEARNRGYGLSAIAFIDARYQTVWVFPPDGHEADRGFDNSRLPERLEALKAATAQPSVTATTSIGNGGKRMPGFIIYAPILRNNELKGYVAAEFGYRAFFAYVAGVRSSKLSSDYSVTVELGRDVLFQSAGAELNPHGHLALNKTYP